ncbi:MAG: cell division protein FtsZ [Bacteroidia bacterium]
MSLSFVSDSAPPIIMVLGVGGAGCNAVGNMYQLGIHGVDFVVCNTDSQVLGRSAVPNRLLIGQKLTGGLGCGADPARGRQAAEESLEEIRGLFAPHTRMVFLTAGLGGGTGTGALPVIAEVCQSLQLLTVAVVSLPFTFEGEMRRRNALKGLQALEECVDALVVIHNDNILRVASKNMPQKKAFLMADQVLYRAVRGIAEIITKPGYINVDFADVSTVMRRGGYALLGMSTQRGENRALMAVEEALSSPLLDAIDLRGARGLLVNITASEDTLTVQETEQIMVRIREALGETDTQLIMGQVFDAEAGEELSLTLIATGLSRPASIEQSLRTMPPKEKKPSPPPIEMELPLSTEPPIPSPSEPPRAASWNLEERLRELAQDPRALERARHSPAFHRYGITPPPLSTARIEPIEGVDLPILRRQNPRLHDNAD